MVTYTTKIEDDSPLLEIGADWKPGSDDDMSRFSGGSFLNTNGTGRMSLQFNGTGLEIFGSRGVRHGQYRITLDGTSYSFDGSYGSRLYNQSLFSELDLPMRPHDLDLESLEEGMVLDVDYMMVTSVAGDDDSTITCKIVENTDAAFAYEPGNEWLTNSSGVFSGGSSTYTRNVNGNTTLTFEGEGITLYGPVGQPFSSYRMALDGKLTGRYNASRQTDNAQSVLYHVSGLDPGKHELKLMYKGFKGVHPVAIGYAVIVCDG
ncbi:hypothetical protein BD626DRAFT_253430 [Schizophyllum amplum]|uniref:Uncharacterized protein n=1 Tax=Schizophyllum amplum TaxID=97359 RepID=A0A550CI70_9AGAR|nr:hypothetical protein BD626DRAFT_253430 [Auriculariopsis ampla]